MAEFANNTTETKGEESVITTTEVCPHLSDVIKQHSSSPWVSVEFFPPKTEAGVDSLMRVMKELRKVPPVIPLPHLHSPVLTTPSLPRFLPPLVEETTLCGRNVGSRWKYFGAYLGPMSTCKE